jgi:hypothetical protein
MNYWMVQIVHNSIIMNLYEKFYIYNSGQYETLFSVGAWT